MFKLKIVSKMVNYKAECCIREVFSTNPIPKTQSYVKIMKYSEKGLFAVTTDVENPGVNTYFWYYDHHNAVWS
jgi:hypothetical protein